MTGVRFSSRLSSRRGFLCAGAAAASWLRSQAADVATSAADVDLNPTWLRTSIRLGCGWITDIAQVKSDHLTAPTTIPGVAAQALERRDSQRVPRRRSQWDVTSPMAHTGQAIKALVMASKVLEDDQPLGGCPRLGADFIGAERIGGSSQQKLWPALRLRVQER